LSRDAKSYSLGIVSIHSYTTTTTQLGCCKIESSSCNPIAICRTNETTGYHYKETLNDAHTNQYKKTFCFLWKWKLSCSSWLL